MDIFFLRTVLLRTVFCGLLCRHFLRTFTDSFLADSFFDDHFADSFFAHSFLRTFFCADSFLRMCLETVFVDSFYLRTVAHASNSTALKIHSTLVTVITLVNYRLIMYSSCTYTTLLGKISFPLN